MKRIIASTMVLAILLSLAACVARKDAPVVGLQMGAATTAATLPPQQEMPAEEKETALRRLEYALLCAAMDADQRRKGMEYVSVSNLQAYFGDYDSDGDEELICGVYSHTFDAAQRTNSYSFSQSGTTMYADKDGKLYLQDNMGAAYDYELDGMWVEGYGATVWYRTWDGSGWSTAMSKDASITREMIMDENNRFVRYGKTISEDFTGKIGEESVDEATFEAHLDQLGLEELDTIAASFVQNRYDAVYTDDLLADLEVYLAGIYGCRRIEADIDGDGTGESLFFLTGDIDQVWLDCMIYDEYENYESAFFNFRSIMDPEQARTCLLVADQQGDELVMDALCVMSGVSVRDSMEVRLGDGFLWLDGQPAYVHGTFSQLTAPLLESYLQAYGYSNCLIRTADLSDIAGAEYLCLCQKDGVWYLLIFVFEDGGPRPIYNLDLTNTAVYLVEQDGRQCLLTYSQRMETTMGGQIRTNYDYNVLRFGDTGETESLDFQSVGYYDSDADATAVAAFFEKLNVYLVKIIVLRDPYRLTGRMWLKQEETEHGTAPEEPEQTEQTQPDEQAEEPVMGFVQINDPGSWLNLREGPGTEYARVLVDPANPESFVKQALGSPVTVLETVETGDAANPVWVKVRISYADREIVGYSSKTYIRIPGEE